MQESREVHEVGCRFSSKDLDRIYPKLYPEWTTEEELRNIFGSLGHVTDCHLKFTKDGVFRKFAFIGFEKDNVVDEAVKRFHHTFLKTSKIKVAPAFGLGDSAKPRAWSKYSNESSAFKQKPTEGRAKQIDMTDKKNKKKKKTDITEEMLRDVKDDPEFQEFLDVHQARSNKSSWGNDVLSTQNRSDVADLGYQSEELITSKGDDKTGNQSSESEEQSEVSEEEISDAEEKKVTKDSCTSDAEFLKSKKSSSAQVFSDSDNESDASSEDESGEEVSEDSDTGEQEDKDQLDKETEDLKESGSGKRYLIKMKGLQGNVKEAMIKDFFKPIPLKSVKIPHGKKNFCIVTVEVGSETDQDTAMRRNKNFIGPKRVFLHKCIQTEKTQASNKPRSWELKPSKSEETESIAESGRLYVRNLAYICTEEDLEQLFKPFGPLSELHLPIDSLTKKIKGFAFVMYMMPEHAVKAFSQLDGQIFKGRILHILPAEPKREEQIDTDKLSFKQKQELERKKNAASSHNWNSLFLGANAVADVMASKYRTSKTQILNAEGKQSLGVRMALGETQIVSETRDFLTENGVVLDAFSQAGGPRSKTLILVKNLPAGTQASQLREIFEKYGQLGRVILPPSGVTALIEFTEVTEAKAAFRNLAYTKFGSVPLYLEWAPEGSLKDRPTSRSKQEEETADVMDESKDSKAEGVAEEEAEDISPDTDTVLFVKNLNFDTTEESLKKHFAQCGKLHSATISKKKDTKKTGQLLSMGYGFVQFKKKSSADKALKTLQQSRLDGHQLELKRSNRTVVKPKQTSKKSQKLKKQTSSKILVRNVPFEAKVQEVRELFSVFGELKTVRLPKKLSGTGSHRGFAFVDFLTKQDAKRAFDSLCHSTHLYGRRLVLEWAEEEESLDELRMKTARHFHDVYAEVFLSTLLGFSEPETIKSGKMINGVSSLQAAELIQAYMRAHQTRSKTVKAYQQNSRYYDDEEDSEMMGDSQSDITEVSSQRYSSKRSNSGRRSPVAKKIQPAPRKPQLDEDTVLYLQSTLRAHQARKTYLNNLSDRERPGSRLTSRSGQSGKGLDSAGESEGSDDFHTTTIGSGRMSVTSGHSATSRYNRSKARSPSPKPILSEEDSESDDDIVVVGGKKEYF